jgi:predicted DNA-binding transcriptional regulator YafY
MNHPDQLDFRQRVTIIYVDSYGQSKKRHIIPIQIEYRSTETHPQPGWILIAHDLDSNIDMMFAMDRIRKWGYREC